MAAIPCSVFSAPKIHANIVKEQEQFKSQFGCDDPKRMSKDAQKPRKSYTFNSPHKYNGKLMNSIWGLYNQYAPPAFQKNFEVSPVSPDHATPQAKTTYGLMNWGWLN